MAKIRIDENALRQNAARLGTQITQLHAMNIRLSDLISRIQDSWEGQASATYVVKMMLQAEKAKKMERVLTEYKKYVENTVERFSDLDRSAANRIRNSF